MIIWDEIRAALDKCVSAFTTTSGCICRLCKCRQTLSYPLIFHCLEMRLPFCFVFLVCHVHYQTTGKQKRAAHMSPDCIRKQTCFKKSLSILIWFYTLFSFPQLMMTVAELYQHNADTKNANGCFALRKNGLSWGKEELLAWVKRAISLKGICVVEAGYSFV